jgi:hypothetical protein
MSEPTTTPIAELVAHFATILTQDNACTAHPIYLVQERERIFGMDPEYRDDEYRDDNYRWVTREVFFTRKGAEEHEDAMAHNYRGGTRVFVDSLYRNHEMRMVRDLLKRIAQMDEYAAFAVDQHMSGVEPEKLVHAEYHDQVVANRDGRIKELEAQIGSLETQVDELEREASVLEGGRRYG